MLEIPVPPPPPPEIELSFIPRLPSGWVGRRRSAAMDPLGKEEEDRLRYNFNFESLISIIDNHRKHPCGRTILFSSSHLLEISTFHQIRSRNGLQTFNQ